MLRFSDPHPSPRVQYGSFHASVTLDPDSSRNNPRGREVANFLAGALMYDLYPVLNSFQPVETQARIIARAAHLWTKEMAGRDLGAEYGPFAISSIEIVLYAERDLQGPALARVDALRGVSVLTPEGKAL